MATDGVAGLDRRSGPGESSRDPGARAARGTADSCFAEAAARRGSRTGELAALSVGPSIELVRAR